MQNTFVISIADQEPKDIDLCNTGMTSPSPKFSIADKPNSSNSTQPVGTWPAWLFLAFSVLKVLF